MGKTKELLRSFAFESRAKDESESDGGVGRLVGTAVVFDVETIIGGYFREVIRPGAFKKTLRESDQVMLWNHNSDKPLGRKSTGTLTLKEDKGVVVDCDLPDTTWGRDAHVSVGRGDVGGMSFRFETVKDEWTEYNDKNKLPLRELLEVRCSEVSPCTFPAYESTEVEARAIMEASGVVRETITSEPCQAAHSEAEVLPDNTDKKVRMAQLILSDLEPIAERLGVEING